MINELFIGNVQTFLRGESDKNGLMPLIINPIFGTCPNRNVLSGTVAQNMGIESGKTYLFNVRETDPDEEYGRRFIFTALKEMSAVEIITLGKEMPKGNLIEVGELVKEPKTTKL